MAGKNVDINFRTTANTQGAKEAEKAAEGVEKALDDVTSASSRQGREAQQSGRKTEEALERVENDAERLREELDKIDGLDPKVRGEVENVAGAMDRAADSGRKMASAKQQVGKSSRNSGLAVLEFSRAIEDAQYGIRGVLNNIPQLVGFLGGGAGLAGAISLAAVGLTQLVERLANFEGAAGDAAETLEVARNQLDEFYRKSAEDGSSAFRAQINSVISALDSQSDALRRNLALTQKKREADLAVAKLTQDLELAQIAQQEATGELSPEQAREQRSQIELSRLQTDSEQKVLKAREEVQVLADQLKEAERRKLAFAERAAKKEEQLVEILDERNRLQARRELAQRALEQAEELRGDDEPSLAAIKEREAQQIFGEESRQALINAERRISDLEAAITQFREASEAAQEEQLKFSELRGVAFNTLQIIEAQEGQSVELQQQILAVKTATQNTTEAQAQLSSGLSDLQSAAADSVSMTEADRRLVETANNQFRKVLADDNLTARELQETSQVLGRLSMSLAGASKQNTEMINSLQVSVDQLSRALATTQAENVRLSQQIKTLNGRQ